MEETVPNAIPTPQTIAVNPISIRTRIGIVFRPSKRPDADFDGDW
jgi:hypothetical protein